MVGLMVGEPPFGQDWHGGPQVIPGAIGEGAVDGGVQCRCGVVPTAAGGYLRECVTGMVEMPEQWCSSAWATDSRQHSMARADSPMSE
jgi:hypothetical protein